MKHADEKLLIEKATKQQQIFYYVVDVVVCFLCGWRVGGDVIVRGVILILRRGRRGEDGGESLK